MKVKGISAAILATLFASQAWAACPVTAPMTTAWACDDYRTTDQWSCFNVTVVGPNPMPAPDNGQVDPLPFASYLSLWKEGNLVAVNIGPSLAGVDVSWTFSQKQLSDGCYQALYTGQGIADSPDKPSFCVVDPKFPKDCVNRVNAEFPAESGAWQFTDTAGVTGPVVIGQPCIIQGPPNNVSDRGSLCEGP
jgi:hypothetical protein